jgi:hypothetical protein
MSFQKVAGISGIVFAALLVVNAIGGGSPPAADASAAEILDYLKDTETGLQIAVGAGSIGIVFAILWAGGLLDRLRSSGDPEARGWATAALIGFIITGTFATLSTLVQAVLVSGTDLLGEGTLIGLWRLSTALFAIVGAASAAFLLSLGMAGLRAGVAPKWLNYVILVGAAISFIAGVSPTAVADGSPIGFAAFGGLLTLILYVLLTGMEMVREAPAAQE